MQLVQERPDYQYVLRSAGGGGAQVNDQILTHSFILAPDTLIENWNAANAATMTPEHLQPLLALSPELIVLGTGSIQIFPSPVVMAACLSQGIGLEAMNNPAAARTYLILASENRKVVAGFLFDGERR
ncbi:MAG: Mth938-like domain-containing protein [Xanthomonadaceae bacterium]|nr:Mth938-like domain-containing protein [Xanthomonadaceae bacterium]